MSASGPVRGTIAVLTFRRPDDLDGILPSLFDQIDASGEQFDVLVVDNDPAGSAAPVLARHAQPRLRGVVEREPGIAAARNRAMTEAAHSRVLVFVDDDEMPQPGWLTALVTQWRRTGATAVVGPVVSQFSAALDPWVAAGGFFERRRHPTGTHLEVAATNNLLLDLDEIRRLDLSFDLRFGLSGGSDTLFTRSIVARGGTVVWCDEAVVTDRVPVGRATRDWVVRRAFRMGNTWSRVAVDLCEPRRVRRVQARAALAASGMARVAGGALRWLLGAVSGTPVKRARGVRTAARGAGMALGAFGYTYSEYKRTAS